MNTVSSVRQGRLRPSFIWIFILLAVLLAACSSTGEPEATAVVVRETATARPTDEVAAAPTEAVEVEPTLPSVTGDSCSANFCSPARGYCHDK